MTKVIQDVIDERKRQDAKWGTQHHSDPIWLAVLTEEVGEASQDILRQKFGSDYHKHRANLRTELVQIAAVAVAWIECMDRTDEAATGGGK